MVAHVARREPQFDRVPGPWAPEVLFSDEAWVLFRGQAVFQLASGRADACALDGRLVHVRDATISADDVPQVIPRGVSLDEARCFLDTHDAASSRRYRTMLRMRGIALSCLADLAVMALVGPLVPRVSRKYLAAEKWYPVWQLLRSSAVDDLDEIHDREPVSGYRVETRDDFLTYRLIQGATFTRMSSILERS